MSSVTATQPIPTAEPQSSPLLEQAHPFLAPAYVATIIALPHRPLALTRATNDSPMAGPARASHRSFGALFRVQRPPDRPNHSFNPNVSLPFHGSCSQCHHYHDGHEFTFSLNSERHTRLVCQRCGHHMFGIGRTPTGFTLASVESGFPLDTHFCVNELPDQRETRNDTEIASSPHKAETTGPERDHDGLVPSTPPNLQEPAPTTSVNTDTRATPNFGTFDAETTEPARVADTESPQARPDLAPPVTRRRTQTIRGQLRKRICAKPRDWSWPGIGLHITNQPFLEASQNPSSRKRTRSGTGIIDLGLDATNNTSTAGLPSPRTSDTLPVKRTTSGTPVSVPTLESPSFLHRQNQPGKSVDIAVDDEVDRLARLRAERREQTVQRENDLSVKCKCNGCLCIKDGSRASITVEFGNESPEQRSSSASSGSQPSQNYPHGHYFSHMGRQFAPTSSRASGLSSAGENQQRPFSPNRPSTLRSMQNTLVTTNGFAPEEARTPTLVIDGQIPLGAALAEPIMSGSNGDTTDQPSPTVNSQSSPDRNEHQDDQPLVDGVDAQTDDTSFDCTSIPESCEVTPTQGNFDQVDGLSPQPPALEADGLLNTLEELAMQTTRDQLERPSEALEEDSSIMSPSL